jgi:SPP1 gp7 family putative phage head morphogenesis protein
MGLLSQTNFYYCRSNSQAIITCGRLLSQTNFYYCRYLSPPEDGEDVTEPMVNPLLNPDVAPPPDDEPNDTTEKKKFVADAHYDLFYVPEAVAELDFDGLTDDEKNLILRIKDMREGMVKYDQATFINTVTKLREALFKSINTNAAVEYGTPDNVARTMMEVNIHRFGFDKTISQVMELNLALRESSGFNDFRKRAAWICKNYNRNYLRTEYDTAISVGQNAAAWNRFKREQNLYPYLKYQTAGDSRVRPKHAALDGKIFAVNDTSWRGIYPPNGYRCRCEMLQLSRDEVNPVDVFGGEQAKAALGREWDNMVKTGFDKNRGETNEVFDLNKTYLSLIADKEMEKRLGEKAIEMSDIDYKYLGYPSYSDMEKTKLNKIARDTLTSPEQMLKDFDHNKREVDGVSVIELPDYAGRTVGLPRKVFKKHLSGNYINNIQERDKIFNNVPDILLHPDEVWMHVEKAITNYYYIRFYQDDMMIVPVKTEKKITMTSWFKLYQGKDSTVGEIDYRKGVIIYKKN